MPDATHKKFRLSLVNAAEDVPRLIRAYGRACGGEFALVLRPPEARGALVLITKDGARSWRASGGSDAPGTPEVALSPKDAVTLVKTEQKAVPKPGPITLRGQWSGTVRCDGGAPVVELSRKLASYGTLRITSSPAGWAWVVERAEKWFASAGSDHGTSTTLVKAIEAGLARAMGLLGEACSVRDSRRRGALDAAWAAEHPVKPAAEGKDPTDRMKPREAKAPKVSPPAESPWTRFDGEAPDADPIERPTRKELGLVRRGGFVHDVGAGSFLGRSVVDHGAFPAGSLVFRPAAGEGYWVVRAPNAAELTTTASPPPPEKPKRLRVKAGVPADAEKDKVLLDAFSAAIRTAIRDTG